MNALTELKVGLSIAWSAIRANKLRSVLTTLGIVIGIVTVTLMGTAIEGLNRAFLQSISFIGADVLYVQRQEWGPHSDADWRKISKRRDITLDQSAALERELTLARAISPVCFDRRLLTANKRSAKDVTILGSTDQLLFTGGVSIAQGRFISSAESHAGRSVCVLGSEVATRSEERRVGKECRSRWSP